MGGADADNRIKERHQQKQRQRHDNQQGIDFAVFAGEYHQKRQQQQHQKNDDQRQIQAAAPDVFGTVAQRKQHFFAQQQRQNGIQQQRQSAGNKYQQQHPIHMRRMPVELARPGRRLRRFAAAHAAVGQIALGRQIDGFAVAPAFVLVKQLLFGSLWGLVGVEIVVCHRKSGFLLGGGRRYFQAACGRRYLGGRQPESRAAICCRPAASVSSKAASSSASASSTPHTLP